VGEDIQFLLDNPWGLKRWANSLTRNTFLLVLLTGTARASDFRTETVFRGHLSKRMGFSPNQAFTPMKKACQQSL
jgi:hypothetical protein